MTNETPAAPAGWYPAPHAGNQLRYWDGKGWLDIAPPEPQIQATPVATTPSPEPVHPQPRIPDQRPVDLGASFIAKPKRRRWPLIVIPLAIVVLIGAGVVHFVNNPPESSATGYTPKPKPPGSSGQKPQVPAAVEPDIPAGFRDLGGGLGLAAKFVDEECSYSMGVCSHMEVYAIDGCPNSVYVEANVLDAGGRVIGFTNDTVGALAAGQTALLEFVSFDDGASKIEISDASCY